jgi:protein Tex
VHPERYALVERIAADLGVDLELARRKRGRASRIEPRRYVGDGVGLPTLEDILAELRKPGRDPREAFEAPPSATTWRDRRPAEGMVLQGTVTNVVAFGAFVDVGVHQDGLVHVSELADRFVQDPNTIVRVGDRVDVRVLSVDLPRKRIALSMKQPGSQPSGRSAGRSAGGGSAPSQRRPDRARAPEQREVEEGIAPNGMRIRRR